MIQRKELPFLNFNNFSFHPAVLQGLKETGYVTPTPIQTKAIPEIMKGRDVMGLAQTGTGKTAAYALPILNRLLTNPTDKIEALILAPTRELAEQIHCDFKSLGKKTGLNSVTVYGGVGITPQIKDLRKAKIVVGCPGRLLDHINRGTIDLSQLKVLVLDEADQMFDMGFFPDIKRILSHLPAKNRQNLLFSATMPEEIRGLADSMLHNPSLIRIGSEGPACTVSHAYFPVPQHLKAALLIQLLHNTCTGSVLVFTRTKHRAKSLAEKLSTAGYRSTSIQGNLSQTKRQAALDNFKSGKYQILVATDIAARGIDISKVSHVINFDIPATPEAYIHRIGRTGRAECIGEAFTLVTDEDTRMMNTINRIIGTRVEQRTLTDFNYTIPAKFPANTPAPSISRKRPSGQKRETPAKPGSYPKDSRGAFGFLSPGKDKNRKSRHA